MKTLSTSLLLSVMFLSAGAFAGSSIDMLTAPIADSANVTVIEKNRVWPLPGRITVEPCNASRCIDV
jgi:hypothetical protein